MEVNRNKEQISEKELPIETVLVLQGGGSLGAYECGVYKTLAKHKIQFDIVSGTSIGALNAAIIASHNSESMKSSAKELENFWLELAETLVPLQQQFSSVYFTDEMRAILASMYSAIFEIIRRSFQFGLAQGFSISFNHLDRHHIHFLI